MINPTSFELQWYAERAGEWRYAGHRGRFLAPIKDRMRDARVLCGDTVPFRIVSTTA